MKRAQWQNNDSQTTFEAKNIKCEEREAAASNQNTVFPIDEQIKTDDVILNLQTDATEEIVSLNNEVQICQEGSDSTTFDNVFTIIEHMDITEPLTTLRQLLEQRLGISLADYTFFLQELTELDSSKTLVHQCVQGEGLVQINVEINTKEDVKKINILDVLKPAEEITLSPDFEFQEAPEMAVDSSTAKKAPPGVPAESEHVTRWIASSDFRQLQEESNIPSDPASWTEKDIKCWITWAMNTFRNSSIDINDWTLSGQELMLITHEEFIQKVPCDPSDVFWTHIELLRKCKIAAVVQQPAAVPQAEEEVSSTNKIAGKTKGRPVKTNSHNPRVICDGCPSMAGGSGQIQLWQFLLELLTDREHRDHIQWIGDEGEFKLINPEIVAQMWGQRKNKPTMNYEKLSRALRYYYDGEMIAKVHGKRFVYKFVCDLKNLLGYSPSTLNRLVTESDIKYKEKMAKQ